VNPSELPLVSVVTPSYNAARYLTETIESVISQDYPRIEHIVMDGGSTDATPQILDRYRGRLQYFTGKDKGPSDAAHRGSFMSVNSSLQQAAGGVGAAVAGLIVVQTASGTLEHYDILGYVVVAAMLVVVVMLRGIDRMVSERAPAAQRA